MPCLDRAPFISLLKRSAAAFCVAALPVVAQAHAGHHHAGGFASGLAHPISGLDHILAMVAVGIWAAQLGKRALWVLPLTFPLVMLVGGLLGFAGLALPGVLILGVLVVARKQAPLGVAAVLVAAFALLHGHAHGTELAAGQSALTYALGFVASTALLHAVGLGLGLLPRALKQVPLERFAGAAVLMGGVYCLWSTLV